MNKHEQKFVDILVGLEPVFERVGKLACEMQSTAVSKMKTDTNSIEADIVTNADLAAQEEILKEIIKTKLVDCVLLAEEDTALIRRFTGKEKIYLTLDPINGTSLYAQGKPYFNLIIGLHNGREMLYTYFSCPKIGWATRIVGSEISQTGQPPKIDLPDVAKRTIVYSYGNPEEFSPELTEHFINENFELTPKKTFTNECGSTTLLFAEKVAGVYGENPNVNDGLAAFHFAQAKGYEIKSTNKQNDFDFSTFNDTPRGPSHPGCYFVAKKLE